MKIGILTLHQADSFGALLQAYALQQTLKKLGADSECINLPIHLKRSPEARYAGCPNAGALATIIRHEFLKRCTVFDEFRETHLQVSENFTLEDGRRMNEAYDFFIVGSDQVWNFALPNVDIRFFLPFADDRKKYSYAASFGSHEIRENVRMLAAADLKSFRRISVREESGRRLVKELTGREAEVHPDPTFLPDLSFWEDLANPPEKEGYLLVYMLNETPEMISYAKEYAQKHNLKIHYVTDCFSFSLGFQVWNTTHVTEWLGLIQRAAAIITNSFHGVIFSLLMKKKFAFFGLPDASIAKRNERIFHLLDSLKVSPAHFGSIPDEEDDSDSVFRIIEKEKSCALHYLRTIIEENKND